MYNPRFPFKVIMLWSFQNHFISLKIDENYGHRILHICFTIFVLHWIVGLICSFIFWQWWCFFKNVAECCFRVECADWVLMIGSSFPVVIGSNKFYFFWLKNYFGNISRFKKKPFENGIYSSISLPLNTKCTITFYVYWIWLLSTL